MWGCVDNKTIQVMIIRISLHIIIAFDESRSNSNSVMCQCAWKKLRSCQQRYSAWLYGLPRCIYDSIRCVHSVNSFILCLISLRPSAIPWICRFIWELKERSSCVLIFSNFLLWSSISGRLFMKAFVTILSSRRCYKSRTMNPNGDCGYLPAKFESKWSTINFEQAVTSCSALLTTSGNISSFPSHLCPSRAKENVSAILSRSPRRSWSCSICADTAYDQT